MKDEIDPLRDLLEARDQEMDFVQRAYDLMISAVRRGIDAMVDLTYDYQKERNRRLEEIRAKWYALIRPLTEERDAKIRETRKEVEP